MNNQRIIFLVLSAIAIIAAYFAKKTTISIASKAISERKLSTGIYRFYPIEGDQAVRLAKGYIAGVKIVFWFVIIVFPFLFILSLLEGTI